MITEEEARTKWCPFVREMSVAADKGKVMALGNRYVSETKVSKVRDRFSNPPGARCIASDCMAWRWSSNDRGWCGLAGEPGPYGPVGPS